MEPVAEKKSPLKLQRKLIRIDRGIFKYTTQTGTELFAVRFKHQTEQWRKFGFPTITKARTWLASRQGAVADGRLFPEQAIKKKPQTTFKTFADHWMATCRAKSLKRSTLRRYDAILRKHLIPALGHLSLSAIDRIAVRRMALSLKDQGLQPKTIHNVLGALSSLFSLAQEDGVVTTSNPALKPSKLVQKPKTSERVMVFTHDEEVLVLETAQRDFPHYYPFILLLFRTGMREGEAVALMPADLDLNRRTVEIVRNYTAGHLEDTPKSGKARTVDLSQDLVEELKDYLVVREAEAALAGQALPRWLFTTPDGHIIRSNNFRDRIWKSLLKKAGLGYRWVHATRHTYASRLIMAGANLVYVQKQLGHSSIQITVDLYTHWVDLAERSQVLEVDKLLVGPG